MFNVTSSIFTAAANKEHKFLGVIVLDPCNIFCYLASCYNVNLTYFSIQSLSLHELLSETCCRHAYDIIVPPCRLSLTRDSFVPATVREWNRHNLSMCNLDILSQFEKAIRGSTSMPIPRHYSYGPRKLNIILTHFAAMHLS